MLTMMTMMMFMHKHGLSKMVPIIKKVDYDDDDDCAQELKVGWFSLLQGLFILLH